MSFLTWAALAIAVLVALPAIAHLLRRRPPQQRLFAAVDLVPAAAAESKKRTSFEDRGLLGIRAAAIVLLALLGAAPLWRCAKLSVARKAGASVAVAVVVDDSMSMRVVAADGRSRFEQARQGAIELIEALEPGDAVAVVLAGSPARVALATTTQFEVAAGVLAKVQQSDRGTDLEGAVRRARELLTGLAHADKRVILLSDLSDGRTSTLQLDGKIPVWIPGAVATGPADNCAVIRADFAPPQVAVQLACSQPSGSLSVTASVSAAPSPKPSAKASTPPRRTLRLVAGNRSLAESTFAGRAGTTDVLIAVPPGVAIKEEKTDSLSLPWRVVLADADAILVDNEAPVVTAGGRVRIGVVTDPSVSIVATGGPPPVEQAMSAMGLGAQIVPLATVPDHKLDSYGLLITDDPPGFTPELRSELTAWVEQGGVLLITLGPRSAAARLGSSFVPLLPGTVRYQQLVDTRVQTGAKGSGPVSGADAGSDEFFGVTAIGLADLHPQGRARLDFAEKDSALRVVTRWQDGQPLLVERRLGRGAVFAMTLPFDAKVSDFVLRPGFLVLLHHLVEQAQSLGGLVRTEVGSTWTFDGFSQVKVSRQAEPGQEQSIALSGKPGRYSAITDRIGLYTVKLEGKTAYRVAAVSPQEIDPQPRKVIGAADEAGMGGGERKTDLSPYVALALLILLASELFIRAATFRKMVPTETGKS